MVYGVLIHSLDGSGRIWFSQMFRPEGNDHRKKARIAEVTRNITQHFAFRVATIEARGTSFLAGAASHENVSLAGTQLDPTAAPLAGRAAPPTTTPVDLSTPADGVPKEWANRTSDFEHDVVRECVQGPQHVRATGRAGHEAPVAEPGTPARAGCIPAHISGKPSSGSLSSIFGILSGTGTTSAFEKPQASRVGAEEGVFRVCRGVLFDQEKVVLWRHVLGTAFAVICDPAENLILASHALSVLIVMLCKHFKDPLLPASPDKILQRPGLVLKIVSRIMPCGELLFANSQIVALLNSSQLDGVGMPLQWNGTAGGLSGRDRGAGE